MAASTIIHNAGDAPISLPYPMRGTLKAGQRVHVSVDRASVIALLGPAGGPASLRTQVGPGVAPYDDFYKGFVNGLDPSQLATKDANGMAAPLVANQVFAAGGTGSARDVIVYDASAPYKFRVLAVYLNVTTLIAASTATLRTAKAGGGSAITSAMATSAVAQVTSTTLSNNLITAGGSLVLRLSDGGVAGELVVLGVKE